MKFKLSKAASSAVLVSLLGGATVPAYAANWLMLQGTEPEGAAPRAKVWGFIQPEYVKTDGTKLQAGPWKGQDAVFNVMRPDQNATEGFNVLRARIGVRGTGMPLDSNVNYFILAEFGNNGITRQGGGSSKVTDASVTLNHFKKVARVRVGTFKTPGSEEGLQAIHVFDYINFTNATNGLLLERYFDKDGSGTGSESSKNGPNGPVGAFRDTGVQVFNSFNLGGWEASYAWMIGNGNGISRGDNNNGKDIYTYLAAEKVFGGKGARRDGLKFYVWGQTGDRTITVQNGNANAADDATQDFERTRSGIGMTFKMGKWRAAFESIKAEGMIFNGTDGGAVPGARNNAGTATASFNMETKGEADGAYYHIGYAITPKLEVDYRYDIYNRMTNDAAKERRFETNTFGVQYFLNKKSRFIVNYEQREAEAPNLPASHNANKILGSMDDRITAQFLVIF